ncbi:PAAR domain-containing protein [Caballeronia grimmiae]|uniref:PAAR repeat-containing protein n=1 Tax=Caballeronia grimmiae TaxID=1071679 RepID=A0A069NDM2_9BURK|nr:PAAR domain-containing protein [Caballeronia grimmiae]KDR25774.1 hypothetical protein BG57_28995 [Caballeronia grimmiae]
MSLSIILVGDSTDHGRKVITGSPTYRISGRSVARFYDFVDCPLKYLDGRSHGVNRITEAHPTLMTDGQRVAPHGHRTECGCTVVGSITAKIGD